MLRICLMLFFTSVGSVAGAQVVVTRQQAMDLAYRNQVNTRAAQLNLQQQQQLAGAVAGLDQPQVTAELSPYEPLVLGIQQSFDLPVAYKRRRALQQERIRLASLELTGNQYELKRAVQLNYVQLQYLQAKMALLRKQDSIYQAIVITAKRFFDAGQINKLEELTTSSQAARVRNEYQNAVADLEIETKVFRLYTAHSNLFSVEPLDTNYALMVPGDTLGTGTIQQQLLAQQLRISQAEIALQRTAILPQVTAGPLFPTSKDYERAIGFQAGISIPIWGRQNRNRVAAAQTGLAVTTAQNELEILRLQTRLTQARSRLEKESRSINFFQTVALPQSYDIIETAKRLFDAGELNYIESMRNLVNAFEIQTTYLEALRNYQEALVEFNYLTGKL